MNIFKKILDVVRHIVANVKIVTEVTKERKYLPPFKATVVNQLQANESASGKIDWIKIDPVTKVPVEIPVSQYTMANAGAGYYATILSGNIVDSYVAGNCKMNPRFEAVLSRLFKKMEAEGCVILPDSDLRIHKEGNVFNGTFYSHITLIWSKAKVGMMPAIDRPKWAKAGNYIRKKLMPKYGTVSVKYMKIPAFDDGTSYTSWDYLLNINPKLAEDMAYAGTCVAITSGYAKTEEFRYVKGTLRVIRSAGEFHALFGNDWFLKNSITPAELFSLSTGAILASENEIKVNDIAVNSSFNGNISVFDIAHSHERKTANLNAAMWLYTRFVDSDKLADILAYRYRQLKERLSTKSGVLSLLKVAEEDDQEDLPAEDRISTRDVRSAAVIAGVFGFIDPFRTQFDDVVDKASRSFVRSIFRPKVRGCGQYPTVLSWAKPGHIYMSPDMAVRLGFIYNKNTLVNDDYVIAYRHPITYGSLRTLKVVIIYGTYDMCAISQFDAGKMALDTDGDVIWVTRVFGGGTVDIKEEGSYNPPLTAKAISNDPYVKALMDATYAVQNTGMANWVSDKMAMQLDGGFNDPMSPVIQGKLMQGIITAQKHADEQFPDIAGIANSLKKEKANGFTQWMRGKLTSSTDSLHMYFNNKSYALGIDKLPVQLRKVAEMAASVKLNICDMGNNKDKWLELIENSKVVVRMFNPIYSKILGNKDFGYNGTMPYHFFTDFVNTPELARMFTADKSRKWKDCKVAIKELIANRLNIGCNKRTRRALIVALTMARIFATGFFMYPAISSLTEEEIVLGKKVLDGLIRLSRE